MKIADLMNDSDEEEDDDSSIMSSVS